MKKIPLEKPLKIDLHKALEIYRIKLVKTALIQSGGNITRAAESLLVNRTTLVEMMKRHNIGKEPILDSDTMQGMALWKAHKIEILLLVEAEIPDEDVVLIIKDAMETYCSFRESVVTIKDSIAPLIVRPDADA